VLVRPGENLVSKPPKQVQEAAAEAADAVDAAAAGDIGVVSR